MKKQDTIPEFMDEAKKVITDNSAKSIMIAVKLEDGSVMTGYFDCNFGVKQELVGHVQCDIIDQMILANLDRY